MDLKLTTVERMILANQCRILEKLYPDEADSYANWREAVVNGYSQQYGHIPEWFSTEEMSNEECQEVLDILTMFDDLNYSYNNLKDKGGIQKIQVEFPGFDGNNESKYLAYANYYIQKIDRFPHFQQMGGCPNSHSHRLIGYRKMLEAWRPIQKDGAYLSSEQIMKIYEAGRTP